MEAGLIALIFLACPLVHGLMMWLMAKSVRGEDAETQSREQPRKALHADLKAGQRPAQASSSVNALMLKRLR